MGRIIFLHRHETSESVLSGVSDEDVSPVEGSCANLVTDGAPVSNCNATDMSNSFGKLSMILMFCCVMVNE